jgi:exopolysaccharide biosynthesis polyprenyl glycosylphosphotransferase
MIETRIKTYLGSAVLTDLFAVCGSFVAAMYLTSSIPYIKGSDGLIYLNLRFFTALVVSLSVMAVCHIVFSLSFYSIKSPFESRGLARLLPRMAALLGLDCAVIALSCLAFQAVSVPGSFYTAYAGLALGGTMLLRLGVQGLMSNLNNAPDNRIRFVVLGTNARARDFFLFTQENRFLGYQVIGFMDDYNYGGFTDISLLAPLQDFERVIRENIVDAVVVFLPIRTYYDKIMSVIDMARIQGIPVQHMYNLFDPKNVKMRPVHIGSYSGMFIENAPRSLLALALKRLFDIVFCLTALLATAPLLLAAALAIKLEDGGPVFFAQSRVGYHKRPFNVYKLRTMRRDAESQMAQVESLNEMDGPVFKIKNDPRITKVGHYLRKFNIDELPQFANVLMGDMSVVGPRPMALRDYKGFSEDWLRMRFSVRPGITCTWQTLANRNDIQFTDWMRMDMEYIENWNLMRDFVIIFRTILVVLEGKGR